MANQLYAFMIEKQEPKIQQNLVYSNECPSFRTLAKGLGGISNKNTSNRRRLLVSYTCSGYNSDWFGELNTDQTTYGIKFNMVHESINKLVVIAKMKNIAAMQNTDWQLEFITPTNADAGVEWNIFEDTKKYFYIYRAFLSSIIEFISVLRTQSQMFKDLTRIFFMKVEDETYWNLFENIFRSLNMIDYYSGDCLVYRMS
jgi:hypothetical protein